MKDHQYSNRSEIQLRSKWLLLPFPSRQDPWSTQGKTNVRSDLENLGRRDAWSTRKQSDRRREIVVRNDLRGHRLMRNCISCNTSMNRPILLRRRGPRAYPEYVEMYDHQRLSKGSWKALSMMPSLSSLDRRQSNLVSSVSSQESQMQQSHRSMSA